jgi:hypothetical protein
MSPDLEEMVALRKREIATEMLDLCRPEGRTRMKELLAEQDRLQLVSRVVSGTPDPRRYVDIAAPKDAIVAYLEDAGEPRTEGEIIQGVLAGGWRGGKRQYDGTLHKSISVFTSPIGKGTLSKNPLLKMIGDRIGLKAWGDARWQS